MAGHRKYPWDEIEAEVFADDRPVDYKQISQKWNIPIDRVRVRSTRKGWNQKKEGVQALVREERKQNIQQTCLDKVFRADVAILEISEMLLGEVASRLTEARERRNRGEDSDLRATDLLSLARSTAVAAELGRGYHHGDVGMALSVLVDGGILPQEIVPQTLTAIEESEKKLAVALKKAFQGRIPD